MQPDEEGRVRGLSRFVPQSSQTTLCESAVDTPEGRTPPAGTNRIENTRNSRLRRDLTFRGLGGRIGRVPSLLFDIEVRGRRISGRACRRTLSTTLLSQIWTFPLSPQMDPGSDGDTVDREGPVLDAATIELLYACLQTRSEVEGKVSSA